MVAGQLIRCNEEPCLVLSTSRVPNVWREAYSMKGPDDVFLVLLPMDGAPYSIGFPCFTTLELLA